MDNTSHEIWKPIEGFSKYEVSNMGNIRNAKTHTLRKPGWKHGYRRINLKSDEGKEKHLAVHRLVAKAFIPNPENKETVNHINAIRHDNRVENLEWMTNEENIQYAIDLGHMSNPPEHEPYNNNDSPKRLLRKAELCSQQQLEYLLELAERNGKSLYGYIRQCEREKDEAEKDVIREQRKGEAEIARLQKILDEKDAKIETLTDELKSRKDLKALCPSVALGEKRNMLTVTGFGATANNNYLICKCDCGKLTMVVPHDFINGITKSCGCYGESLKNKKYSATTHPTLYSLWNRKRRDTKWCDEWQDFEAFAIWAEENFYEEGLRLNRYSKADEYCADNCFWAEPPVAKPVESKPKTLYDFEGEQLTLAEISKRSGKSSQTLAYRMSRGMTIDEAVSVPLCSNGRPRGNTLPV